MKLEEIDLIDAKSSEAAFTLLAQVVGVSTWLPSVWAGPCEAGLRRDDQRLWIRVESFVNELFDNVWPIRIGGVNQVDAEFDATAQDLAGAVAIVRRTPHTGAS